ncbi:MAG: hypothetical protein H7144_05520, partial [Burkholderiales bacterium]|nr:hypothetical protein [Phycisphaerae bacterium]
MSLLQRPCLETLESRQLLSSSLSHQPLNTIGATGGVTASATTPRTTGIVVDGGTSAAYLDTAINLAIQLGTGGPVKETSLKKGQFQIFEVGNPTAVTTGNAQTSGGGDTLVIKPTVLLKPNTDYVVQFNQRADLTKITDISNTAFTAATYTFHTGTFYNQGDPNVKFTKQTVASKQENGSFSAITIGPDGRLYAATLTGHIHRWNINADGTLAGLKTYTIVRDNNGGARFITGITFDPRSTSSVPILWVSHGQAKFGTSQSDQAQNYTGKISRLTNNLESYQDVIVNIPRSVKDHLNNQISFDPANKNLYFVIPSHSAMGRADGTWGNRAEELATAALYRLQLSTAGTKVGIEDWLSKNGPINLDPASSKPYSFTKGTNPLRYYATGIRNAYDMVWHTNGRLYVPTNGSAAGGNTPRDPNQGSGTQISNVQQTIDDYLYDIQEGGYYGHPNPTRGEYILQGGDPTAGKDDFQVTPYPDGTQPDSNYRGAAFSFGKNQSPDGVIEYKSNAFGGRLKGSLIVARYSSGDDLVTIKPRSDGTFRSSDQKIGTSGMTGFENPLDLVEDTRNGNIYVVSLVDHINGKGSIQLLKPDPSLSGQATPSATRVVVYATSGNSNGATKTVSITNTGQARLTIDMSAIRLTGVNRRSFLVTGITSSDVPLDPGESHTFTVKFVAQAGDTATKYGNLAIATDDPRGTYAAVVQLRGVSIVSPGRKAAPATIGDTGGVTASAARPVINVGPNNAYFNAVRGKSMIYQFRIKNVGAARLDLKPGAITIRGENRFNFEVVDFPADGISIVPGRTVYVNIRFKAFSGDNLDIKSAVLRVASSDPRRPVRFANLRGLPTAGEGGSLEPSLQKLFNLFNLPIKTGQTNVEDYRFPTVAPEPNDEVVVQQLVKAGPGDVTIKPLAVFGNDSDPAVRMGYYIPGVLDSEQYLWYTPGSTSQSVAPLAFGQTSFDPGTATFGLVTEF